MGLLDRLKNNRPDDDGAGERTPTNFDELQAEGDEGRTVAMGITRAADLDLPTAGANLTSTVGGQSIISELPPSEQLSDFSESRLMPAATAAATTA